jgi:anti-sigma factor RsiW
MHDILVEELEGHLSGKASQAFYDHVDACAECAAAVAALSEISDCLQELKPASQAGAEPPLGFYNRVAGRIVENQRKEAWGLFSPGAAFFRRIAFASLLVLAGLGSFLVTREAPESGNDAAAIIAAHDPIAAHSESADRDRLLVTLADYRE